MKANHTTAQERKRTDSSPSGILNLNCVVSTGYLHGTNGPSKEKNEERDKQTIEIDGEGNSTIVKHHSVPNGSGFSFNTTQHNTDGGQKNN